MPYDFSYGTSSSMQNTSKVVTNEAQIPEGYRLNKRGKLVSIARSEGGKKAAETKKKKAEEERYNNFVQKKRTQRQINLAEQNAKTTESIKELSEKALTSGKARVENLISERKIVETEKEKKLLDEVSSKAGQSQARLMQRQQQLQADKLRPDLADAENDRRSRAAGQAQSRQLQEIEAKKENVRTEPIRRDHVQNQIINAGRRAAKRTAAGKIAYKPTKEGMMESGAYAEVEIPTREQIEKFRREDSTSSRTTEQSPKTNPNGDGKTSNKAKWGKRAGFMGVGMAVLGAAGLAVNSLMINDKGRMNNAQMYGQQPYSQY